MASGRPLQATVLLDFIQGEEGPEWAAARDGWDMDTFVCDWEGIECDSLSFVTEINLEGTSLLATIPSSIISLASLQRLILASNRIYGTLPSNFGVKLHNLVELDLSENKLRGSIPDFGSKSIEVIILSHNQFSGKFPPAFGVNLDRLSIFDIKNNRVSGVIPNSLGQVVTLMELDLSDNKLSGPIPFEFGNLIKLQGLFLSNNELIGHIPMSLTREYLPLKQLHLHKNFLSGTLPVALANLPELEILFIDGNKITGTVPREICDRNFNDDFFSEDASRREEEGSAGPNQIEERNGCTSVACAAGFRSTRSAERDGVYPCVKCEDASLNPYLGSTACLNTTVDQILLNFYLATDGVNWRMGGDSWKDTSVPPCDKHGIECAHDGSIIAIQLKNMQLSGTITESLGFLRTLESLDLSDNMLFGNVPNELQFLPLEFLDISGNMMTGFVPHELCEKEGINENGMNGVFLCSNIVCPVGTYSTTGRSHRDSKCLPCNSIDALFLGSKSCSPGSYASSSVSTTTTEDYEYGAGTIIGLLILVSCTILFLIFMVVRYRGPVSTSPPTYIRGREKRNRRGSNDHGIDYTEEKENNSKFDEIWEDVPRFT